MTIKINTLKSIAVTLFVAMLFSCQGKLGAVRKMGQGSDIPQAVGKKVNLFYTDSGNVRAHLKSPKLLDFSNHNFAYQKFPEGVKVYFYNQNKEKTTVIADYAVVYKKTDLVDLQGHVKIITPDSVVLKAEQLYWNQALNWVFTDKPYSIKMQNGAINHGQGFDSNENFNTFISRSNVGVQYVEEEKSKDSTQLN